MGFSGFTSDLWRASVGSCLPGPLLRVLTAASVCELCPGTLGLLCKICIPTATPRPPEFRVGFTEALYEGSWHLLGSWAFRGFWPLHCYSRPSGRASPHSGEKEGWRGEWAREGWAAGTREEGRRVCQPGAPPLHTRDASVPFTRPFASRSSASPAPVPNCHSNLGLKRHLISQEENPLGSVRVWA